ncbi:MAG: L-lysine 6-transaminase [Candidatus Marinimicrobia bacterium]|nr:L-lysine 6-transaminase [Candidatus Neomarinimicrobiota bacterium]MCF7828264.1 L-lysine 6-transaminase [Candidatus Neomarinimicrobiota bacterium]MCF7879561.1 L-lysine 6-transaminase [Candidatus Neomarinimicrobiota bacterium]
MSRTAPEKVHEVIGKNMLADGLEPIVDLEKSHGSWVHDPISGRDYLDLFSCFASMPVGWNHPRVVARKEELAAAAVNKPTNSDIYSTQMADFVETFTDIAKPDYFKYMFFISGGALAVENALKASFDWKYQKELAKGNEIDPNAMKVLHFEKAFHGRTGYTLSLTNTADPRKTQYFPKFDWPRVSTPAVTFPITAENLSNAQKLEKKAINEINEYLEKYPDTIAALIIEPIQGEGGDNHFRDAFMVQLREICDEHDIMFVMDEVQSGVGITGKFWAHEHFSINPDMIAFGKKSQVCGFMSTDRIDDVEKNVFHESSRLNSTWGGNIVDMVRFMIYLEIIQEENLVSHAEQKGHYLQEKLLTLKEQHPEMIINPRGRGLMCAFDLPDSETRNTLMQAIWKEGALILGSGTKTIRFRPHLNVSTEEIDQGIEIVKKALTEI